LKPCRASIAHRPARLLRAAANVWINAVLSDLGFGADCVTVTGHIDQPEAGIRRAFEEDQFLGAARGVRGPASALRPVSG